LLFQIFSPEFLEIFDVKILKAKQNWINFDFMIFGLN